MGLSLINETNCSLTRERLVELFDYDPFVGVFIRRESGRIAGTIGKRGYVSIMVDRKQFKAHRLAWLYMFGVWPKQQIDHRDGNKSNNRIANLREATNAQNKQNMVMARSDSSSGILGVFQHAGGKWVAQIGVSGKLRYLGLFKTPELAHRAYMQAKLSFHEFVVPERLA